MTIALLQNRIGTEVDYSLDDIQPFLGADKVSQPYLLTIYLPNRDANGVLINVAYWVEATVQFLTHKFGGVSVSSAYQGFWLNPETDKLVREVTYQISVFVEPDDLLRCSAGLARHIRRFGREAGQGEVLVQLNDKVLRYVRF